MTRVVFALSLCALLLAGCPDGGIQNRAAPANTEDTKDPQVLALRKAAHDLALRSEENVEFVEVQHILISFEGRGTPAKRTKEQAEKLAAQVLAKSQGGTEFSALVKENTDDQWPGIYGMVTDRAKMNQANNILWRKGMVAAFGNVGWRLKVGEVGVAAFDLDNSPYGWHIIKRLK